MKTENMMMLGGGAIAIYFVLKSNKVKEQLSSLSGGFKFPDFNIAFPDISMPSFDWLGDIAKTIAETPLDIIEKGEEYLDTGKTWVADIISDVTDIPKKIKDEIDKRVDEEIAKGKEVIRKAKSPLATASMIGGGVAMLSGGAFALPLGAIALFGGSHYFGKKAGTQAGILSTLKTGRTPLTRFWDFSRGLPNPPTFKTFNFTPIKMMGINANIARGISNTVSSGGGYGEQFGFTPETFTEGLQDFDEATQDKFKDLADWVGNN